MNKFYILLFLIFGLILVSNCASQAYQSPVPHLEQYFKQGRYNLRHRRPYEAITNFKIALVEAQAADNLYGEAAAYLALALAYQQQGDIKNAVWFFNQASEIVPLIKAEQPGVSKYHLNLLHGQYYETLAQINLCNGEKKQALENLKIAQRYYANAID